MISKNKRKVTKCIKTYVYYLILLIIRDYICKKK